MLRIVFDCFRRFRRDRGGQIAVLFALSSTVIVVGIGAGIDLSRGYAARSRLSEVATLTCQFSIRPSVVQTANSTYSGTSGFQTYLNAVNAFAATSLATEHWTGAAPTGASGGAYFTATAASGSGTAASTAPTNQTVEMFASVPTSFMQIAHVTQIPVHAKVTCPTASTTPQIVNPTLVVQEGFETGCVGYCDTLPSGASGTAAHPTSVFPASPSFTGAGGAQWYIIGYCLEVDQVGVINATTPEGTHAAELDCDNGSGSAGNSSISTKVYLADGYYELRYNYRSRVDYPNYDPTYICGSTASDLAWANDTNSGLGTALRTNQINAYLDMASTSATPLHTTIDGTQQLGGTNLIDMCVYSPTWIERSVKFTVTTPAYYWLSFAADGANDSYGGQLDNIRLCQDTCSTTLQDNFPTAWLAANNGGVNKVLFEDTFEYPSYTQDATNPTLRKTANLSGSIGTSGTLLSGWPSQTASGWATAPFNQTTYVLQGATQGQQFVMLDGYNSNGNAQTNRLISRPFLLDPGYYQVGYDYIPLVSFSVYPVGTFCYGAPASGQVFPSFTFSTAYGAVRNATVSYTAGLDTNVVGVFMANGQLVSTPVPSSTQNAAATYSNPNGTVSSTPTVAPDAVNWSAYNAAAVNPVIDVCGYSDTWAVRSVAVKITKPGLYWLTFSAQTSTADGYGGSIDDVKLTALGSPYMTSPPVNPTVPTTTIPVPAPQPDTTYSNSGVFNGFYIVADSFKPPAANQ